MTRTCSVLALIVSCLFAAPALADAETVARECIEHIRDSSARSVEAIHTTTEHGIARLRRLHDEGASDRELIHAARESTMRVHTIADSSSAHIARTVRRCVRTLRELEASDALIAAVREAGQTAHDRINRAAQNGTRLIHRALRAALDD